MHASMTCRRWAAPPPHAGHLRRCSWARSRCAGVPPLSASSARRDHLGRVHGPPRSARPRRARLRGRRVPHGLSTWPHVLPHLLRREPASTITTCKPHESPPSSSSRWSGWRSSSRRRARCDNLGRCIRSSGARRGSAGRSAFSCSRRWARGGRGSGSPGTARYASRRAGARAERFAWLLTRSCRTMAGLSSTTSSSSRQAVFALRAAGRPLFRPFTSATASSNGQPARRSKPRSRARGAAAPDRQPPALRALVFSRARSAARVLTWCADGLPHHHRVRTVRGCMPSSRSCRASTSAASSCGVGVRVIPSSCRSCSSRLRRGVDPRVPAESGSRGVRPGANSSNHPRHRRRGSCFSCSDDVPDVPIVILAAWG